MLVRLTGFVATLCELTVKVQHTQGSPMAVLCMGKLVVELFISMSYWVHELMDLSYKE